VLAAGPGAVLSHRSAAALWGMHESSRADVEVTDGGVDMRGRFARSRRAK